MKVRDFMIHDVIYANKGETLRNLLRKLMENKIGGVPVLDADKHLIGMVSDGDVLRAFAPQEQTVFDLYSMIFIFDKQEVNDQFKHRMDNDVTTIMTKRKLYYVHPDDDFEDVLKILSKHHFKKIPVVNKAERVVGVVSRGDVIRFISQQMIGNEDLK